MGTAGTAALASAAKVGMKSMIDGLRSEIASAARQSSSVVDRRAISVQMFVPA